MMKYIHLAIFVYLSFYTCLMLWWNSSPKQRTIQNITMNITQEKSVQTGVRFSLDDSSKYTVSKDRGKISLRLKNTSSEGYILLNFKGERFCNGHFLGYDNDFAKLQNVVINPGQGKGRYGGENITQVLNQPEKDEFYTLDKGYFILQYSEKINYKFRLKSVLNMWKEVTATTQNMPSYSTERNGWTIAVLRNEYANLYHTMADFYNTFLIAKAFRMEPDNITILWIDGHPKGALDETWTTLFGKVMRAGDIKQPCKFSNMVWGIPGYNSFIYEQSRKQVPYLDEFRSFFLSRHGVSTQRPLTCSKLNITLIWRRNYLAHPRRPNGSLTRKIKNEAELLQNVQTSFPTCSVIGVQIDKHDMKRQLEIMSNTDILVGMHGAGLAHALFLPGHAGMVEMFPGYWGTFQTHLKTFAEWRNIHYLFWQNVDPRNDLRDYMTEVNVTAVTDVISNMVKKICK